MMLCPTCGRIYDDDVEVCADDGDRVLRALSGPATFAGRYRLEQRLAAGAMGVVFRAEHLELRSSVALKMMRTSPENPKVAVARFRREAQILGRIKHPHAVLVMDFGVEQRGPRTLAYIVTEYLRGRSLQAALQQ